MQSANAMEVHAQLKRLYSVVGEDFIAFHPRFVTLTGRITSALMLGQAIYWTRRYLRHHPERDGWFWKTQRAWNLETGLSRKEQETARATLRDLGILEERRRGQPAKLYFRLNLDRLGQLLAEMISLEFTRWNWNDHHLIAALLGKPVVFYRRFAGLTDSACAALLLSRAFFRTRLVITKDPDGWFETSMLSLRRETQLSRRELDTARRKLRGLGVLEERRTGVPPRIHCRLNIERLLNSIPVAHGKPTARGYLAQRDIQGCRFPANSDGAKGHPRMQTSCKQACPNPPHQYGPNGRNSWPVSHSLYKGFSNTNSITKPQLPPFTASDSAVPIPSKPFEGSGGDWIYPTMLLHQEIPAASRIVERCPDLAQALLDELAGRKLTKTILNPLAYLRELTQRALAGEFVPEVGIRIAAARDRQQEELRRQAKTRDQGSGQQLDREAQRVKLWAILGKNPPPITARA